LKIEISIIYSFTGIIENQLIFDFSFR
jgi:hypothetical protein